MNVSMTVYGDILWTPTEQRRDSSQLTGFLAAVLAQHGADLQRYGDFGAAASAADQYRALHRWSVAEPAAFWRLLAEYTRTEFMTPAEVTYVPPPPGRMLGAQWFRGATLNYAANLLAGPERGGAVVALAEGAPRRSYSLGALKAEVARCAAALRAVGVGPGDRVAGVIANIPEALIAMLATTAIGGVWSSCSPDFGADAVCDRLAQIEPKVVFFTTAYRYGGKLCDCAATIAAVRARLPGLLRAVLVSHLSRDSVQDPYSDAPSSPVAPVQTGDATPWDDFLGSAPAAPLSYAPRAFGDPLFIMFSSGTTGVPKAIVHSVGGTLLQHKKELLLHSDIGPQSRLLFYTTCGWMMWNWTVSALAVGASLVLFEGSPAQPDLGVIWRAVRDTGTTALGTSPKFIATCMSAGIDARAILGSRAPRTLLSTGAPLLPEHFAWIYAQVAPPDGDLHLASISGGTDILSCFMLGVPTLPVRAGEIQAAGLGMDIAAWDDAGQPLHGQKGELVCTTPFPSMPIGFWRDADGERYRRAYFDFFPAPAAAPGAAAPACSEVWRHGDFIEITATGGIIVYGRSDATLNPGGVRIGTAELYREVEKIPEVSDSVAVAYREPGDEAIVLFVRLAGGTLDAELTARIKTRIRTGLSPRHVPKMVVQVRDIPYTRSGKKVELAVTQAIHGEPVLNMAALANPEAMADFQAWGARTSRSGGPNEGAT